MEYGKKNGDPEEIYPNNNISTKENDRQQRRRPQFSITETYIKTGGKKNIVPGKQTYVETASNIWKTVMIGDSHTGRLNTREFNEKMNGKVYFNVFWLKELSA